MSLHDMSVFAGGRRVNLNLFAIGIGLSSHVYNCLCGIMVK